MPPKKRLKGEDGEAVDAQEEGAEEEPVAEEPAAEAEETAEPTQVSSAAQLAATPKTGLALPPAGLTGPAEVAEPEGPREPEEDAKEDSRRKIEAPPCFQIPDTTLNVQVSSVGNVLMMLNEGGLHYLFAGARANVGIKSGRYMFEVKILEVMSPLEDPAATTRVPKPSSQLRLGFTTAASNLFLGNTEEGVSFDSDGNFIAGKTKTQVSQKFTTGDVIAVVLNLDSSSPNANTVSLFKDGVRVAQPQALPENLQGEALYPTITFKNVVVSYNFGPVPLAALPFKCRMVNDASQADATVKPAPPAPKDGQYEVLFPICLPDEGGFDWLDQFLKQNPTYTELSDRALLSWCEVSALSRPKGYSALARSSNDKPEMGIGIAAIDDLSIRRVLNAIVPIQKRNYVVMELKSNLMKDERAETLSRWAGFKRVATVAIGEPPLAFKKISLEKALQVKQEVSDADFKAKQAQAKTKWLLEKKQKDMEKDRKKAAKKQQKMQEAMMKKLKYEQAKKEAEAKGEPAPEPPAEEKDEEEEEAEESEEPEPMEEDPPKVQLTAEEKKRPFFKGPVGDLTTYLLNTSFQKFSLPEKAEGFEEITYVWSPEPKATQYMKSWIQERKLTSRVEDLLPGEWFSTKYKEWQKTLQAWHAKQNAYKAAQAKKVMDAQTREAKKKVYEAAKAKAEKDGAELPAKPEDLDKEPEEEEDKADFEHIDVFSVEDVNDIGGGEPLYIAFQYEDWTMLSLRFELYLLSHAFRKDANDPDRVVVPMEHMPFYYQKYFKKTLNSKSYGVESNEEVLALVKDTMLLTNSKNQKVLEAQLPEELECNNVFIMLTEEHRRDRSRRIDMGDESAKIKLIGPGASLTPMLTSAGSAIAMPAGALAPGSVPAVAATPSPLALRPPGAMNPLLAQMQAQRPPAPVMQQPQWGGAAMRPGFNPMAGMRPGGFPQARPFQAWRGW